MKLLESIQETLDQLAEVATCELSQQEKPDSLLAGKDKLC
jgi:hypothetical protein